MHTQLGGGNGTSRKQGADRFKDDLMFRLDESMLVEGLHKSLPLTARGRLIAQRAEGLEFGGELCFSIHLVCEALLEFYSSKLVL